MHDYVKRITKMIPKAPNITGTKTYVIEISFKSPFSLIKQLISKYTKQPIINEIDKIKSNISAILIK